MILELAKIGGKNQKFKTEAQALEFFAGHGVTVAGVKPTQDKK